ncbi:hypothetical protein QFZ51_002725 [Chitinophaga sp. W3I9]|uniref:YaaC family protein n=1 Tax=Chitinophaga sp. W3I9 TaxID=3373924 RepID=UPI003D2136C3
MIKKIWNNLQEFETRDLVERYIGKTYDRKASARQIIEITSNFIQGKEYFRNAADANISVKPLLLYYGVSALSRGLILACSPHISESSLKPSHGLSTNNWQEVLSRKDFQSLSVSITQGTFNDLLVNTKNKSNFRHNTNAINWNVDFPIPPIGTIINFAQLVQTIPDLKEQYERWTERRLPFLRLQQFMHHGESHYEYTIYKKKINEEDIADIFSKEQFGDYSISEEKSYLKLIVAGNKVPQFSQSFADPFNTGMGDVVITRQVNPGTNLSLLGQYYSLSFFLGMLCRYFPSIWISLSRTEKGDAIFPLLTRIMDDIETIYPSIVLDFLRANAEKPIKE